MCEWSDMVLGTTPMAGDGDGDGDAAGDGEVVGFVRLED